jgi:hypothetical protein
MNNRSMFDAVTVDVFKKLLDDAIAPVLRRNRAAFGRNRAAFGRSHGQ